MHIVRNYLFLNGNNKQKAQADIYDINGRNLGRFNNLKTIPASNLKKGVYILRVTTNRGINNVRFVK